MGHRLRWIPMLPRLQGRIQLLVAFRSGGIFKDSMGGKSIARNSPVELQDAAGGLQKIKYWGWNWIKNQNHWSAFRKKTIKGNQGFWYFDHPEWRALHIPPLIIIIIHNNLQQPEPATDPSEASCSSSRIPALHRQPSIPSKLSFGGCRRVASEHGESSQEDLAAFLSTYGFVWK